MELHKFVAHKEKARLLLRVLSPTRKTKVDLSKKVGCTRRMALLLLREAKALGINVIGFSFHTGFRRPNAKRHVEAITACNACCAKRRLG